MPNRVDHRAVWLGSSAALFVLALVWTAFEVQTLRAEVRAFAATDASLQGSQLSTEWSSGGMVRRVTTGRGLLEDRAAWTERHRLAVETALVELPRDR